MNNLTDNIKTMKRNFFAAVLVFSAAGLFAAPLDGGYSQAPGAFAPPDEKNRAFLEARYKVINEAVKYEHTPYLYGGISKSGLDCSGFIYISFKDALGVSLPRSSTGLYSWAEKIPFKQAQAGDLLFFKTGASGKVSHVGLYLGNGYFIHSASEGPVTGVIYSNLEEKYWSRTFTGAGRAFPESSSEVRPVLTSINLTDKPSGKLPESGASSAKTGRTGRPDSPNSGSASTESGRLLLGVGVAPTWVAFLKGGDLLRGFASQFRLAAETYTFGPKMVFGMEVRPEYDGALGVFRLPITLSWGPSDKIMIFAGPVFSFGDPSISTDDGKRLYSGGTSWIGAAGLTAAPFIFNTKGGEFAPYLEAAWQYYFSKGQGKNPNADFSAGFRFSTGLRWSIQVL
jgi:probable lipoprotein NlpC